MRSTNIRFYVSQSGAGARPWFIDSVSAYEAPDEDIRITHVQLLTDSTCSGTAHDTLMVVYRNYGKVGVDTVFVGYLISGTSTYYADTIVYPYGFGGCSGVSDDYDTLYLPVSIHQPGLYWIKVWARAAHDAFLDDTVSLYRFVGDTWVYLNIHTRQKGNEIFWKLFYMPDSIGIDSVKPNTYVGFSTYYDSVCLQRDALYRYEAWDQAGDGWHGGTYRWFSLWCGDTIVWADNNGNTPNNHITNCCNGDLESYEYFTVHSRKMKDVGLVTIWKPDLNQPSCAGPIYDTLAIIIRNYGLTAVDTAFVGFDFNGVVRDLDTLVYSSGLLECAADTISIDTATFFGLVRLSAWATTHTDTNTFNDTVQHIYHIGNIPVFMALHTLTQGNEIYWKLFYMPDSIGIDSVWPGTYDAFQSYLDTFCLVEGATYRYEAWDAVGDGWQGASYFFYLIACNDTFVLARDTVFNRFLSKLEKEAYFTVSRQDVALVSLLQPDTTHCWSAPVPFSLVVNNFTEQYTTASLTIQMAPNAIGTYWDTSIASIALQPCIDTIRIAASHINSGLYALTAHVALPDDIRPENDSLQIRFVRVLNGEIKPNLPDVVSVCASDTPAILDASVNFPDVHYVWNTQDTTPLLHVTQTDTYIVTLTYSLLGCIVQDTAEVYVWPNPEVTIIGPEVVELGASVSFIVSPSLDDYTYLWNTGDTTPYLFYEVTQPGVDTLWVVVTNAHGCSDTATKVLTILTGIESAITYGYVVRYYPVSALVRVQAADDIIQWAEVRNVQGQVLIHQSVNRSWATLSLQSLPAGAYLLLLKGQQAGLITYRLLKR